MTNEFTVFQNYKDELELILRQNPYEQELYSVIMHILRSCIAQSDLSLRNVSADRKAIRIHTVNFMSDRRFPDLLCWIKNMMCLSAERRRNRQSVLYSVLCSRQIKLTTESSGMTIRTGRKQR